MILLAFLRSYRTAKMPPACPVESHAGSYKEEEKLSGMPRACPVEPHAGCYEKSASKGLRDATSLSRGNPVVQCACL
jgi:hypothetical protein